MPMAEPCIHKGRRFESQRAAAVELGVTPSAISYHLAKHGTLDRIGAPRNSRPGGPRKPVTLGQRRWASRSELARYVGTRPETISDWLTGKHYDRLLAAVMRADVANFQQRNN